MKFVNREFTYPVETPNYSDYDYPRMDIEINVKSKVFEHQYIVEYRLKDVVATLRQKLDDEKAVLVIVLENQMMFYRCAVKSKKLKGSIRIESSEVNGKVELLAFIISNDNDNMFTSDYFIDWYKGETSQIEIGDILAVSDTCSFDANHDIDPFKDITSIFSIRLDDRQKNDYTISYSGKRIEIILNSFMYNKYELLKSNANYQKILVNTLVFPALTEVISNLKVRWDNGIALDGLDDVDWYRTINKKYEVAGEEFQEDVQNNNAVIVANKLLGTILSKSMSVLNNLVGESI